MYSILHVCLYGSLRKSAQASPVFLQVVVQPQPVTGNPDPRRSGRKNLIKTLQKTLRVWALIIYPATSVATYLLISWA